MSKVSLYASTLSARNQMAFQERMANTAHQREVEDLRAAGLNPVLSSGGSGAAVPSGAAGDYSINGELLKLAHSAVDSTSRSAKAMASLIDKKPIIVKPGPGNSGSGSGGFLGTLLDSTADRLGRRYPLLGLGADILKYVAQNGRIITDTREAPTAGSSYKAMEYSKKNPGKKTLTPSSVASAAKNLFNAVLNPITRYNSLTVRRAPSKSRRRAGAQEY